MTVGVLGGLASPCGDETNPEPFCVGRVRMITPHFSLGGDCWAWCRVGIGTRPSSLENSVEDGYSSHRLFSVVV